MDDDVIRILLRVLFWIAATYTIGYGALWLGMRLYVSWYMRMGGL